MGALGEGRGYVFGRADGQSVFLLISDPLDAALVAHLGDRVVAAVRLVAYQEPEPVRLFDPNVDEVQVSRSDIDMIKSLVTEAYELMPANTSVTVEASLEAAMELLAQYATEQKATS